MSIRTFLFCDICNPQAVRTVDTRMPSGDKRWDRRASDGRAWFEGDSKIAINSLGWRTTQDGRHLCPGCAHRHPELANTIVIPHSQSL